MDGVREVGPAASVLADSSFLSGETLVSGAVEESSYEANKEEIIIRDVGSDVLVHVVSGDHDAGDRDGLGKNSDVYVDVVGGDDGREGDDSGRNVNVVVDLMGDNHYGLGENDEGNIGLRNVGNSRDHLSAGGTESLTEEGIPVVTEERTGEVVEMERVDSTVVWTNAETHVVIMTTEVNVRKEVEDQGMVDGVRKDVVDQGLVDGVRKEVEDHDLIDEQVLMGSEMVDLGSSVLGHSSHGGVLGDEVWNPGIVSVMHEADGVQKQKGTAMPRESTSSFKHDTSGAHETVQAASELSVPDNANHTSAACPLMIETDGAPQQEVTAMVQAKNSRVKDEIPGADDMVESASELSVPDNANPNSAACPLMLETDRVQQQEGAASVKDEIPGSHEMVEAASEVSVQYNANYISAACLLIPETDGKQQHEASVPQKSNSSFKNETPGAHEMVETASELSIPDNAIRTSASCPVMIETDGVQHEVVTKEVVTMLQGNNSTFKGEIPGTHETASEVILDNANQSSVENLNNSVEVNVRENVEVIYAEERLHSTVAFSESNGADQTLHSSCGDEAINDNPIIEASGSHDNADGGSVISLHHDAFVGDVSVVDCKISSRDDDNGANFGSDLSVEDSKEVSVLANPVISCKHDFQVIIGSDIGVGTEDDHFGKPPQGIVQEEVESHVEFDSEPDGKNDKLRTAENNQSMKQEVSCGSDGGQDTAQDSTYEQLSDVDRGDWIMMDIDDVLDLKGEAAGLGAPMEEICCAGNTEDFCAVPMTGTNHVNIASELNIFESEGDVKDGKVVPNCAGDKEVHKQVAIGDTEIMADKDDENFIEYSDVKRFQQENENLDTLDVGGTAEEEDLMVENTVVLSSEQIISTEACSVKSEEAIREGEDSFSGKNSQSAQEMSDTSGTVSTVEGSVPVKTEKEDKYAQENQISGHEFQKDDKVSAEEAFGSPNSHVEIENEDKVAQANQIIGHEAHGDDKVCAEGDFGSPISLVQNAAGYSTHFVAEGNNDSVFQDGIQNINMSAEVQEAETMETSICEVASSAEVSNQVIEREDEDPKTMVEEKLLAVVPEASSVECQPSLGSGEQYTDGEVDDSEQPLAMEGDISEMDQSEIPEEGKLQSSSHSSLHQSGYFEPPEADGEFSVSDLVWGKVRSHPWWPGQIFDPSDASDRSLKHFKKDSFLVAYFGDRTFAWNDASVLKPFRPHFSQIAKQRNSEALQIAVSSSLDEVSRRIELGLSCSCTPRDVYEKIDCQIVENAGIREESSQRYGVDKTTRAALFEPDKLLEHIRALALAPLDFCDQLELALAKAQLSAFCHFKGYRPLPLFESKEASFEDDTVTFSDKPDCEILVVEMFPSRAFSSYSEKESLKDGLQPKKERSLSELMSDREFSLDEGDGMDGKSLSKSIGASSGKKRKAVDSKADGSDQRVSIYAAKVSTTSSSPRPSFKVGDCISRVATQLTGAASSLKPNNGQPGSESFLQSCSSRGNVMLSPKNSTLGGMLSQLQLAARDPKKGYSFLNNIIIFFSGFRNSVVSKHVAGRPGGDRKRKTYRAVGGSTEDFEFDDVNDSYWRDKAIQNSHDEHLLQNGDKSDDGYQPIVSPRAKMHKPTRRLYTRKQYSTENYETSLDDPMEEDQSMKRETSPAELIMNFSQGSRIPSQINLNNMFRRFGPLKEYETEVDQDSCRARVIFKRGTDAEVAYSSSGTFNIFGSMHVAYQLSYSPSSTLRNLPLLISQGQEDAL